MVHRIWFASWRPTIAAVIGLIAAWALRHVEERQLATRLAGAAPAPAPVVTPTSTPAWPPPVAPHGAPDVQLVVAAGEDSFIRLDAEADVPTGTFRMIDKLTAVASVRDRDVPAAVRAWRGREVIVDGGCRAKVTGFVVISRLEGYPEYAGVKRWTSASVAEHGSHALFGRLSDCFGTWARAAALPPVQLAAKLPADPLLDFRARSDLFATAFANDLQIEWKRANTLGDWRLEVPIATQIVRAPDGLRYVLLHAHNTATCGDFGVDVLAVYRENSDGTLQRVSLHNADLNEIDNVLAIDGYLYASGTAGLTDYRVIEDLDGENQVTDYIPFVGCPC
jgi:hypothetical protein